MNSILAWELFLKSESHICTMQNSMFIRRYEKSNLSTSLWNISCLKKKSSFVIEFIHNIKTLKGNDFDIVLIISLFLSKILLYDLVINSRTVLYFTKIETVKLSNYSAQ